MYLVKKEFTKTIPNSAACDCSDHETNHCAFHYLAQLTDLREKFNGVITSDRMQTIKVYV